MISAWLNAIIGCVLVLAIGIMNFEFSAFEAAWLIVASNLAGMASLLLYSFGGRHPWARRHLLHGAWRTWPLFLLSYFGLLALLAPKLRDPVVLGWLVVPVIMTTGFCILAFGPIQDKLVARSQRRVVGGA